MSMYIIHKCINVYIIVVLIYLCGCLFDGRWLVGSGEGMRGEGEVWSWGGLWGIEWESGIVRAEG